MGKTDQTDELDGALREILARRDNFLEEIPEISADRLGILNNVLAREFPVDAALRAVATRRDQLLNGSQLKISGALEISLRGKVKAIAATQRASRTSWRTALRTCALSLSGLFQSPMRLSVATACLMVAAGILLFGQGKSLKPTVTEPKSVLSVRPKNELLVITDPSSIETGAFGELASVVSKRAPVVYDQLNLRVSMTDLAYLRSSFLAINRAYLAKTTDEIGIRLDLTVRPILIDGGIDVDSRF
jgi:hypothetical protein